MSIPPEWANKYIGIRYEPHGHSETAADCWYFLCMVMKGQFDKDVPTYAGTSYVTEDDRERIARFMAEHKDETWKRIDPDDAQPGDCILFNMLGYPIHVGVVCAPGLFLHCERGCNSCVERYHSGPWKRRIEGFYRLR
jgi:cell wall-associated NlpC family hydrolase